MRVIRRLYRAWLIQMEKPTFTKFPRKAYTSRPLMFLPALLRIFRPSLPKTSKVEQGRPRFFSGREFGRSVSPYYWECRNSGICKLQQQTRCADAESGFASRRKWGFDLNIIRNPLTGIRFKRL